MGCAVLKRSDEPADWTIGIKKGGGFVKPQRRAVNLNKGQAGRNNHRGQ